MKEKLFRFFRSHDAEYARLQAERDEQASAHAALQENLHQEKVAWNAERILHEQKIAEMQAAAESNAKSKSDSETAAYLLAMATEAAAGVPARRDIDWREVRLRQDFEPLPTRKFESAEAVVEHYKKIAGNRSEKIVGFEGFTIDDAIFDIHTQFDELWSHRRIALFLLNAARLRFARPLMLELGCGPSHIGTHLRQLGFHDYLGLDINPYFIDFNPNLLPCREHYRHADLCDPFQAEFQNQPLIFDLVFSFEVLEHIDEDRLPSFFANIVRHMGPDSLFLCSASQQAFADVHVTVQPRAWWEEKFAAAGLSPHPDHALLNHLAGRSHPFHWNAANSEIFSLRKAAR
jgi:2-polyprenyl-3-methyl-5-hydroxy-6-metoxy-1,4-benzoquinol methylase